MTASRTCRACGASLAGDVMWCLQCYEPVRQLTPREPPIPAPADLQPIDPATVRPDHVWIRLDRPVYSRVRAGATTWGLWGRVGLTIVVIAFAPFGVFTVTSVLYLLGYVPIAVMLLRAIWHREVVGTESAAGLVHDVSTINALRTGAIVIGALLAAVALATHAFVLGYLPALSFILLGVFPSAMLVASEALEEARARPLGTFVLLNGLNVLDAMLSQAAITAGAARELNPLVLAIGTPAKIVLVAACSALLLWRRPRALVWPALAFLVLAAYHLTGLLGALSIG